MALSVNLDAQAAIEEPHETVGLAPDSNQAIRRFDRWSPSMRVMAMLSRRPGKPVSECYGDVSPIGNLSVSAMAIFHQQSHSRPPNSMAFIDLPIPQT
jgi:hypothetical protein